MGMIGMGNECYLYVNGISVSKPIWLHDTVCISPAKSAIKWKEVMPLFENDIDFSIAVLCNPTIASQLHIIGDDTEHLIANAWNSQWDCVLLVWGDRIFEKCGIGRDERGDGGKTLEIRGKRRLPARDRGANYQQS